MTFRVAFFAAAGAAVCACGSFAVEVADFEAGTGTEVWTVSDGVYVSPAYGSPVDRIALSYSGDGGAASAEIRAKTPQGVETPVATLSGASSAASFDFPESVDFRTFRVIAADGWRLSTFAATLAATTLAAPDGVAVSNNTTGTSFDLRWNPVADATGYRVFVWTNATATVAAGAEAWLESFSNAPSTTSNTTFFKDAYTDSGATGWTFDKVYACTIEGAVRIGNTSTQGVLVSPALPRFVQSAPTLRIKAWRLDAGDGESAPVSIVSGGATNEVARITLTTEAQTFEVALPELHEGDRLAFHSPTDKKSARMILDEVEILSDYYVEAMRPSYLVEGRDAGAATECTLDGLPSVPVQVAVAAYGRRGAASGQSAAQTVDLANPDKVATLNAVPLSTLANRAYSQNFDSLAALTASTGGKEWLDGATLPFWQAAKGADAAASVKYNRGTERAGGLYALASNQSDDVRALGGLSTKDAFMAFGVAFTNDTGEAMTLSAVECSAQQWGFNNTAEQPFVLSCLVTDRLDWMRSYPAEDWQVCAIVPESAAKVYASGTEHNTPESTNVAFTPESAVTIPAGSVLVLKWALPMPADGSSAMMAIDDLTVTFVRAALPFAVILVRNDAANVGF